MRERDIRNDLHDRLLATNAFTDVWISGLPEDSGSAASDLTAAAIEPVSTNLTTGWDAQLDGAIQYTSTLNVTVLARNEDPQLRDELAEQLLQYLKNAVNGQSLAGITYCGLTHVNSWQWMPPTAPERRIKATVGFSYEETWDGADTST